jgi:hypothetical protein
MLPGFRFLFVAIVLSMSILVFGLGAAALLRAAHEEFASSPSWHVPSEATFAEHGEATRPVLAMLHVDDPAAAEQKAPDNLPAIAAPADQQPAIPTSPEPAASAPTEADRTVALEPDDSSHPEPATAEGSISDNSAQREAPTAQADRSASADTPAAVDDTKIATTDQPLPPANEPAPAASEPAAVTPEQANAPASPDPDLASTKIATLGGPTGTLEPPPPKNADTERADTKIPSTKAVGTKPDRSLVKKRLQARRAAQRRRMALRARAAQQAPQPPANPFAQPLAQPAAAAHTR